MNEVANTLDLVVRNALLQSTFIFLLGLLLARFAVRRPARVHTVLVLAFLAAIVAPLASEAVRRGGWGVLPPEQATISANKTAVNLIDANSELVQNERSTTSHTLPGETKADPTMVDAYGSAEAGSRAAPSHTQPQVASQPVLVPTIVADEARTPSQHNVVFALFALLWLAASAHLVRRLVRGVVAARRVLQSATPCNEPAVRAALVAARDRLGMNSIQVDVYQSSAARCPMIWCWAARPKVLLPVDAVRTWSAAAWTPILCHELAHWKRRDHLSALLAEAVCCLMPWQALAWWSKRRLEHASEQACDDWTVAVGHSAADYAETLLGLVAQADPPLALAALRRRSGLAGRIQHILSQAVPHPRLGRVWAIAVLVVAATSIGVTAVCQRGVARADAPQAATPAAADKAKQDDAKNTAKKAEKPKSDAKGKPAEIAPAKPAAGMAGKDAPTSTQTPGGTPIPPVPPENPSTEPEAFRKLGQVLTPEGEPIAGADVYWDIRRRRTPNQSDWPAVETVATTKTNDDGYFAIEAKLVRADIEYNGLVIRAEGYGINAPGNFLNLSKLDTPAEIWLEPSLPLEGTIYSPDGMPVANARVAVASICRGSDNKENFNGHFIGLTAQEIDEKHPRPYWPAPVATDADGKFRIDDATPSRSTAELVVTAPDFAQTFITVGHPDSLIYNTRATMRDSGFTLVLELPYVVDGRFQDETSGAPIANARVEVQPYSNNGTMANRDIVKATSDADGRYTMRVGSADTYFVKVFPPLGYPAIQNSISSRQIRQFAGADRQLKYELNLRPGIVQRGRVVDAETGEGVTGAQVYYKPQAGRKLGVNNDFFPVTTADDGTFEASAVDGKGFFLVDAPGKGFYRLAVHNPRVERYREGIYPHALLEVDLPKDGSSESVEIALQRGPPLLVKAVGPDGKPVGDMRAACPETTYEGFFNGESCQNGTFRLEAAEPGRKYYVYLSSESAKAGGAFHIEAPADGQPVEVTLQPWATVRGRYVYDGGDPAPEITNFTRFRIYPDRKPEGNAQLNLPFYDNFSGHMHVKRITDEEGNFELDGLIPGAVIYLNLNNEFANGERNYEVGILKPGEVKDVGELVIHATR